MQMSWTSKPRLHNAGWGGRLEDLIIGLITCFLLTVNHRAAARALPWVIMPAATTGGTKRRGSAAGDKGAFFQQDILHLLSVREELSNVWQQSSMSGNNLAPFSHTVPQEGVSLPQGVTSPPQIGHTGILCQHTFMRSTKRRGSCWTVTTIWTFTQVLNTFTAT